MLLVLIKPSKLWTPIRSFMNLHSGVRHGRVFRLAITADKGRAVGEGTDKGSCSRLSFTVVHCHSLITVSVTFIIFGLSSASPFLEVYALDGDALTVPLSYVLSTVRPLNVPTTW